MNSFLIENINKFLGFTQRQFGFLSENSFIIKNINFIIGIFASLSLILSLFASTKVLGVCVICGFLALLLKYILKPKTQITIDIFDFFVILYVGIFCLATAFSSWFTFSMHGLLKIFIYFFSYLNFKEVIKSYSKAKIYFMALLGVLVSVESFIAIAQQVFGVEMLATWQDMKTIRAEQIMNRVYGSLQPLNPNLLGGYLVATMPALIGSAFYDYKKIRYNIWALLALFSVLLAIIFTGCRGAYVATFIQGVCFVGISGHIIWHDFTDKKWLKKAWLGLIIAGLLSAFALVLSSPALQHRIISIFAARSDSSNSFRFNVYNSSFRMFLDNWLTGIGVGNWTFREVYGCYMLTGYDALGAYSVPLEIAVETGIFGLLNFITMIVLSFGRSIKAILSKICYNQKVIITMCFLSIVGMAMHGIVDTIWFRPQIQFVFWLMLAMISIQED